MLSITSMSDLRDISECGMEKWLKWPCLFLCVACDRVSQRTLVFALRVGVGGLWLTCLIAFLVCGVSYIRNGVLRVGGSRYGVE